MSDNKNVLSSQKFKKASIFAALALIIFCLLVLMTLATKNSWKFYLGKAVENTLFENDETSYKIGDYICVNTGLASSTAIFELNKNSFNDGSYYAVIIKITTMYGPLPAVFIYEKNTGAQFIDFILAQGKVKEQILHTSQNSQIAYWANRIPGIVEKSLSE